jgi:hypothetical protein
MTVLPRSIALSPGQWFPRNREVLNAWLLDVASRPGPKVAVFDWDNTSMYSDIGVAVLLYQLDRLALRLSPEQLAAIVPSAVNGLDVLAGEILLPRLREDILDAYGALWPRICAGDVEGARALPEHQDFRAKMGFLYDASENTPGMGTAFAYPWLARWLAGFRPAEAELLAIDAARAALAEPPRMARWTSASAGRAGTVSYGYEAGLMPQPEMIELMGALGAAGVMVFVVSASQADLVRGVARHFGYPVPSEQVYGLRLEPDGDGTG